MEKFDKNLWDVLLHGVTILGASIAYFFTFLTWRKTNRVKRSEFLEALIKKLDSPSTFLARKILDDFWVSIDGNSNMSDIQLLKMGSEEISTGKIKKEDIPKKINDLLRDHRVKPVTLNNEQRVRQSFDDLLDFFAKLEYYYNLKLITKKELSYFTYYFKRCAYKADGAVLNYAKYYSYDSLQNLIDNMDIKKRK